MRAQLRKLLVGIACLGGTAALAVAKDVSVEMHKISSTGIGEKVGIVVISESQKGLTFKVTVQGIPAGQHGFHVHEKGQCGPGEKDGKTQAGLAAGGHYDPEETKSHQGPEGHGHKGDLPALDANAGGIDTTVTAPRLKLADIRGRALVIHEGGDTYSDTPELGGGKGRIVCGVIPKS